MSLNHSEHQVNCALMRLLWDTCLLNCSLHASLNGRLQLGADLADVSLLHLASLEADVALALHGLSLPVLHTSQLVLWHTRLFRRVRLSSLSTQQWSSPLQAAHCITTCTDRHGKNGMDQCKSHWSPTCNIELLYQEVVLHYMTATIMLDV